MKLKEKVAKPVIYIHTLHYVARYEFDCLPFLMLDFENLQIDLKLLQILTKFVLFLMASIK